MPKCPEDWFLFNFFRTYSDVLVTTGKILRMDDNAFDPSLAETMGF